MASKSGKLNPLSAIVFCSLLFNLVLLVKDYRRSIVTHVVDGDTLQLADNRRVRLRSIDAPEKERCMATEARQFLEQYVLNRHIRLKDQIIDEYGRIVAIAIVEDFRGWIGYITKQFDPLLNRVMLTHGFARYFASGSTYDTALKTAVSGAKSDAKGIYSQTCRHLIPQGPCTIKGNLRSGEKTYYLPSCRDYDQVIVDKSYGDMWFCSVTDAQNEGFFPSSRCEKE